MSQNNTGSPARFGDPESVDVSSPIIEAVGSPGHAAALLARINARARARKEGLLRITKSPSSPVTKNTEIAKNLKSAREKKLFTKESVNNSEKCMTITPTKEVNEKAVIEFVVDAAEDSESLVKKIKNKLKNEISENEEQQLKSDEKDIHSKKKKKKKRKEIAPDNDTVDSFIDEEKDECIADLELQPLKKKKNEGIKKLDEIQISIKDKNEDTKEEIQNKNVSTGFEDFFCISDEKECLVNATHSENEVLEDHSNKDKEEELVMKMELDEKDNTEKDSSVKEDTLQINTKNPPSSNEILKSSEHTKGDTSETIQTAESLLTNDEPKKRKRKNKNKNKESSEKDGNAIEGDTSETIQTAESLLTNDEAKKRKRKKKKKNKESSEKDGNAIEGFTMMGEVQTFKRGKIQRVLPFWLSHPTVIERDLQQGTASVDSVSELDEKLVHILKEQKITSFFPIQKSVIPQILAGASSVAARYRPRDICVSAPTGSGKTLAFVLPIVQALSGRTVPRIRALVLLPVQELAIQVYKVFLTYAEHMGLNVGLAVGLKGFAKEQSSLIRSDASGYHSLVDILVATPGKLSDHLQLTKGIDLTHLRYLVLDEADRMLAADGGEWVERIEKAVSGKLGQGPLVGSFPSPGATLALPTLPLQHLLFSATLSHDPEQLQHLTLYRPKLFTVTARDVKLQTIDKISEDLVGVYTRPAELREQFAVVEGTLKPLILHHLAATYNWRRTLVFTNTTEATHKLATLLQILAKDLIVKEFSSIHKRDRKQIISQFKAGKIDMLIATDAMARGLDVPDIEQVVSYDVTSVSTYVHRIGRTARAGKTGTALSLVTKDDVGDYRNVLAQGGGIAEEISIPMEELEVYEESYKESLTKMKEGLLQEKQERRNKIDGGKGKQKGRLNNKRGLRKGIKRLQNGGAKFPSKD